MAEKKVDITGTVCPFCVIRVKEELDQLNPGDHLKIICDHPPAARDSIPAFIRMNNMKCNVLNIEPGLWEITVSR